MKRITRTFAMPARLAASLTLTACGSSGAGGAHDMTTMSPGAGSTSTTSTPSGPSAATAGTHNDPDVAFAKGMIPHHGQAVVMADLALEKADGEGFDRLWLQMMIKHHEGAVAMARTELSSGSDAGAKQLPRAIIDGQTKEFATMTSLRAGG